MYAGNTLHRQVPRKGIGARLRRGQCTKVLQFGDDKTHAATRDAGPVVCSSMSGSSITFEVIAGEARPFPSTDKLPEADVRPRSHDFAVQEARNPPAVVN
jgi:hypothetical protein